jgi:hypothetical protein
MDWFAPMAALNVGAKAGPYGVALTEDEADDVPEVATTAKVKVYVVEAVRPLTVYDVAEPETLIVWFVAPAETVMTYPCGKPPPRVLNEAAVQLRATD